MRVYHKPFVPWIWVGCMFMALGGAMAALDKRYRRKVAAKLTGADIKGMAV
jgi:cytochrome c-type biogenesis protein CcmF